MKQAHSRRAILMQIATTLGPERCADALAGFNHWAGFNSWSGCVLALAYGERGRLVRDFTGRGMRAVWSETLDAIGHVVPRLAWEERIERFAARSLGLSVAQVQFVVAAYDTPKRREGLRRALMSVAARGVPSSVVLAVDPSWSTPEHL